MCDINKQQKGKGRPRIIASLSSNLAKHISNS